MATNPIATAQANTVPVQKTWQEIENEMKSIAREAGKEGAMEALLEEANKQRTEDKKLSESQKARKFMANMKAMKTASGRASARGRVQGLGKMTEMLSPDEFVGVKAVRALPLLAKHNFDAEAAAAAAEKHGNDDLAKSLRNVPSEGQKIMNASDAPSGGFALSSEVSDDIIGFLYDNSLVRSMGAVVVPNATGDLTMPKLTGTSQGYWVGENREITVSQPSLGAIKLGTKTLAIAIPVSQHLMSLANGGFEQIIYNDAARVIRIAEDSALIRADGSEWKPQGILSQIDAGQISAANASNAFADIVGDLFNLQYLVEGEGNLDAQRPGYMMSKRDAFFLKSLISTDGTFIFLPQMMQGQLIDAPWGSTGSIPKNLGGGADESELYYGDFSQIIIGQNMTMTAEKYRGAAFLDGAGNPVYGAQQGVDLIVIYVKLDMKLRHDISFAVKNQLDWSAAFDA